MMIARGISLLYPIWLRARGSLLAGLALAIVGACMLRLPMFSPSPGQDIRPAQAALWFGMLLPMTICFGRVVNACAYWNSDMNYTPACYPSHMLVLPVRTLTLTTWPTLFGGVLALTCWLFISRVFLIPAGLSAPLIWPGILLAMIVAATQLIAWSPVPAVSVRLYFALSIVVSIGGVVLAGLYFRLSSNAMTLGSLLILFLEYGAITNRLSVARRGDGQTWPRAVLRMIALLSRRNIHVSKSLPGFSSPIRAQIWLESRLLLWAMPRSSTFCSIFCSLALIALFALPGSHRGRGDFVAVGPFMVSGACFSLGTWFVMPLVTALIIRVMYGRLNVHPRETRVSSFFSVRPLSSARFILSKLVVAAMSAALSYLFAVAVFLGAGFFIHYPRDSDQTLATFLFTGASTRRLWILIIVTVAMTFFTWRKLVIDMYVGFGSRLWIRFISGIVFIVPMFAFPAGLIAFELHPAMLFQIQHWVMAHLSQIVAYLALIKCILAGVVIVALYRLALMSAGAIAITLGLWITVCVSIFVALEHYVSSPFLSRPIILASGLILVLPLVRLLFAPLSLHWNRHQ